MTKMNRVKTEIIAFSLLLLILLRSCSCFVTPSCHEHPRVVSKRLPWLEQSSQSYDSRDFKPKKASGILGKAANAVTSWLHPNKPKVGATMNVKDVDSEVILDNEQLSKLKTRKRRDAQQPFPLPFRAVGESITRSLSQEQRKAKPLLKDAQKLIKRDKALLALLGSPVHIKPIFSTSSSTSTINWKKTRHIVDRFVVVGSKASGVATLIADKYAKGHIKALRVDISGIHHDINIGA